MLRGTPPWRLREHSRIGVSMHDHWWGSRRQYGRRDDGAFGKYERGRELTVGRCGASAKSRCRGGGEWRRVRQGGVRRVVWCLRLHDGLDRRCTGRRVKVCRGQVPAGDAAWSPSSRPVLVAAHGRAHLLGFRRHSRIGLNALTDEAGKRSRMHEKRRTGVVGQRGVGGCIFMFVFIIFIVVTVFTVFIVFVVAFVVFVVLTV